MGIEHWTYRTYLPALTTNACRSAADRQFFYSYVIILYILNVYSLFSPLPPLPPRSARGIPSGARYPYVRYSLKARLCGVNRHLLRTYVGVKNTCTRARGAERADGSNVFLFIVIRFKTGYYPTHH